ncbi:MAG: hypothetical protein IPJ15_15140 [Actinomycetales bacterium]|nr:hypothetical protein [Candidatus Phosphoribacter baldrii]
MNALLRIVRSIVPGDRVGAGQGAQELAFEGVPAVRDSVQFQEPAVVIGSSMLVRTGTDEAQDVRGVVADNAFG